MYKLSYIKRVEINTYIMASDCIMLPFLSFSPMFTNLNHAYNSGLCFHFTMPDEKCVKMATGDANKSLFYKFS